MGFGISHMNNITGEFFCLKNTDNNLVLFLIFTNAIVYNLYTMYCICKNYGGTKISGNSSRYTRSTGSKCVGATISDSLEIRRDLWQYTSIPGCSIVKK